MKERVLLIVIGTDELPSKALKKLGKDFLSHILSELKIKNICSRSSNWFASPRQLAIKLKILYVYKKDHDYKNSQDVCSFSLINNHTLDQNNDKNISDVVLNNNLQIDECYKKYECDFDEIVDEDFRVLLIQVIKNALKKLVNYIMMYWGSVTVPFIRPVNTFTILLDSCLIEECFFKIYVDRIIYGNKCLENNMITLNHANDYPSVLIEKGYIIPDYNERKKIIQMEVEKKASELGGVVDMSDDNFLEEITALIEWPVVLFGRFNKRFLRLPSEVIIHILKKHQKYFPVYSIVDGMLLPCFIFVVNTVTDSYKKIIFGHESVICSRFMDVEFFIESDGRFRLEDYIYKLDFILFHRKLGSLKDKVDRITELSGWLANQIHEDIENTKRASYLCKCDLVTSMVLEFPNLQGIMGMYYARRDGELESVSLAQKEHYYPQFNSDILPTEQISCIVSISDKMDTITGMIGIKDFPTGSRDPFGLKRMATGLLRIIIQKKLFFNLFDFIHKSVELYESRLTDDIIRIKDDIYKFIYKRLCLLYSLQGYKINIVKSILNTIGDYCYILDLNERVCLINKFYSSQNLEYKRLCLIYKRMFNILKEQNFSFKVDNISVSLFEYLEETQLFNQVVLLEKNLQLLFKQGYYSIFMLVIKVFNLTDNFLNRVHVIHENLEIRNNRLSLIYKVQQLTLKVIDISALCG